MKPKIVLFDLETIPHKTEALRNWPALGNWPGRTLKATVSTILCAGWKIFEHPGGVQIVNAWDFEKRWRKDMNDDFEVVKKIREVLVDADAVITQNGVRFDMPFLQTRILKNGLKPLPQIPHIDTKKIMKANLSMFSNSLNHAGEQLVGQKKLDHEGWELWCKIFLDDDEKAKKKMARYCKQDVNLLEKIFLRLRPFIKNLPNRNLERAPGDHVCPNCGAGDIARNGTRATKTVRYQRYQCKKCFTYFRTDARDRMART